MDTAHNTRGLANAGRVQANPTSSGFARDNLCWLRSTWISVFEQADSADDLAGRIRNAQIAISNQSNNAQMLARAVFGPYKQNPLAFLHHGEEHMAATAPAHFRTGQSFESFCQEFDQPALLQAFQANNPQRVEGHVHTIEGLLKNAVMSLAPGIRETLPELKGIDQSFGVLASSDIAVAVHRALNLPLIVMENSGTGQVSLRVSAPNNHPLKAQVDSLFGVDLPDVHVANSKLQQLLVDAELPVLHLQGTRYADGHYTLYLPRNGGLGTQLSDARIQATRSMERNNTRVPEVRSEPVNTVAGVQRGVVSNVPHVKLVTYPFVDSVHLLGYRGGSASPFQTVQLAYEFSPNNPVIFDFVPLQMLKNPQMQQNSPISYRLMEMRDQGHLGLTVQKEVPKRALALNRVFSGRTRQPLQHNVYQVVFNPRDSKALPTEGQQAQLTLIEFGLPVNWLESAEQTLQRAQALLAEKAGNSSPMLRSAMPSRPEVALSLLHGYKASGGQSQPSDLLRAIQESEYLDGASNAAEHLLGSVMEHLSLQHGSAFA
jgi:hypothetical protein